MRSSARRAARRPASAGSARSARLGGFGQAQRQDVGTKIKVIPHVNDSDQVRLELTEEISDAGTPLGALGAIPINKRTANTTLIVRDQQTVVIGGLVRDAFINGETKVPVLGDIPVLGFLFKQSNTKKQKSNLLLVLTPYVIRDQDDLRAIFERKMQERQEFLDRYFVVNEQGAVAAAARLLARQRARRRHPPVDPAQEEKERIERRVAPKPPKVARPSEPIPLPQLGGAAQPAAEVSRRTAALPAAQHAAGRTGAAGPQCSRRAATRRAAPRGAERRE